MNFHAAIHITIIPDHVHIQHAENLLAVAGGVGSIGGATPQALFLTGKEDKFDWIVEVIFAEHPGRFHYPDGAAGIVVRSRGVIHGIFGCIIIVSANDVVFIRVLGAGFGGDHIIQGGFGNVGETGLPAHAGIIAMGNNRIAAGPDSRRIDHIEGIEVFVENIATGGPGVAAIGSAQAGAVPSHNHTIVSIDEIHVVIIDTGRNRKLWPAWAAIGGFQRDAPTDGKSGILIQKMDAV